MNSLPQSSPSVITLETISRLKTEKLIEIRASKQHLMNHARSLFRPSEAATGTPTWASGMGSGIAVFNGIITGYKLFKRIRSFFRRK